MLPDIILITLKKLKPNTLQQANNLQEAIYALITYIVKSIENKNAIRLNNVSINLNTIVNIDSELVNIKFNDSQYLELSEIKYTLERYLEDRLYRHFIMSHKNSQIVFNIHFSVINKSTLLVSYELFGD